MKKGTQVSEKIPAANRQYKDTVFRMLFSEKENLLSLYNAVTGKAYQNADDLKIVTLENAIYMGMKNDLAFMLETNIYLYEHQSTLNPNIPLRDLIYIGIEYQQYVDDKSLYSSRLQKIPSLLPISMPSLLPASYSAFRSFFSSHSLSYSNKLTVYPQ